MSVKWRTAGLFLLQIAAFPGLAAANSSSPVFSQVPEGEVVLTVSGMIQTSDNQPKASFDMRMLEALPHQVIKTANPWQKSIVAYEGVLLRDLMTSVGAHGTSMTISALDGFEEDMAISDAQSIDVILAYKQDGHYMPVRGRGPLFVVFPFTDEPALLTDQRLEQSVWQVNRITIK